MKITVNDRLVDFESMSISYGEVIALAGITDTPYVTYGRKRDGEIRREGTMHAGCSAIPITDEMAFNVTHTGGA